LKLSAMRAILPPYRRVRRGLTPALGPLGSLSLFTLSELGTQWPSGDFREIAILPIDEKAVADAFHAPLHRGDETGLGPWAALGMWHSSGILIELICYQYMPPPNGFIVRVDSSADFSEALESLLPVFNLQRDQLPWISELVGP
jgi:hypothetical protein